MSSLLNRQAPLLSARTRPHPALSVVFLEIFRGRTAFPRRPVSAGRFCIGAGDHCHLRLGGDDVPPLHSIIDTRSPDVWMETVADAPPLAVNGIIVREALLHDGDVIELGAFCFIVRKTRLAVRAGSPELPEDVRSNDPIEGEEKTAIERRELEGSSAEEIVDLIEREQELVRRFERGREFGAAVLLHAVRERRKAMDADSAEEGSNKPLILAAEQSSENGWLCPDNSSHSSRVGVMIDPQHKLLHELQQTVAQIDAVSLELERHSGRPAHRTETDAGFSTVLLAARQRLIAQLECLLKRLKAVSSTTEPTRVAA